MTTVHLDVFNTCNRRFFSEYLNLDDISKANVPHWHFFNCSETQALWVVHVKSGCMEDGVNGLQTRDWGKLGPLIFK